MGVDQGQLGANALRADDVQAAAYHLRCAAALAPEQGDVLGNLAACSQRFGREAEAGRWLQRLLARDAADQAALIDLVSFGPSPAIRARMSRRVVALAPGSAEAWSRAAVLRLENDAKGSLGDFARARAAGPTTASTQLGVGLAWRRLGRGTEAAASLRQGLALAPERVDGWDALAAGLERPAEAGLAIRASGRAIALEPLRAAGWLRLGVSCWQGGQAHKAMRANRIALALVPQLAEAMANLGIAMREGATGTQPSWFARVVALVPGNAGALTNLGTTLRPGSEEALRCHARALMHEPAHAHALNNLGSQHLARNELARARSWFERSIASGFADGEAKWNRGVARLLAGDLPGGFADYEERWELRAFAGWRRAFSRPIWRGEAANGRTMLVHAEQGLGDTIQFVRYLEPLARAGWRIVLECQPALVRLLRGLPWVGSVVAKGEPLPAFDMQVPLLSLAQRFGTTLETIPSAVPYLGVGDMSAAPIGSGSRIGVVWAGNPEHKNDSNRSLPVEAVDRLLAGLARLGSATIFSLQVGARAADLRVAAARGITVLDLAPRLTDFAETAAIVLQLDMVIGVDTAVMHLTGALGCAGSILLPFAPDWRWFLARQDSPWYPTLRLYRQPSPGDWSTPVDAALLDVERSCRMSGQARR
ncbi:MAG: hypothetical protein HYR63_24690 [Proteobacteria bacterium]|nr:hypothetical protein [Pseudomonadota bacterium]